MFYPVIPAAWRWVPCLQRDLRPHLRLARGNLLAAYELGLGVPFLAAALLADGAAHLLAACAVSVWACRSQVAVVALWLLERMPVLGTIG